MGEIELKKASDSKCLCRRCYRHRMPFCQLANGLSQHFAEQPLYRPTLCCLHLCVLHFSKLFFLFLFCIQPRGGGHCSLSLGLFPGHKDSSMTSLLEQTVAQPTQSKVCAINGTSKVIFYVGPEFKLLQTINLSKHGSTNTSCSPNLKWSK